MIICFWTTTSRGIPGKDIFNQSTKKLYNEVLLQHIHLGVDAAKKKSAPDRWLTLNLQPV